LVLVHLIYWFVVHPWLFAASPRPALIMARDAAVAELASAEPDAPTNASFKPVELPYESGLRGRAWPGGEGPASAAEHRNLGADGRAACMRDA